MSFFSDSAASKLYKALDEESSFDYVSDDFAKTLFHSINDKI